MKICLISVEIFAWGKHGGFGKATRTIGRELARRGHDVFAIVPRRAGQKPVEELDGITVLGVDPWRPWTAADLARRADADIYHSCEPSTMTVYAMNAMPGRKHVVTFRDPRNLWDWALEFHRPSLSPAQVVHNFLFENNPWVRACIRRMDAVYTISPHLVPKVRRMYRPKVEPAFLPTPVVVPEAPEKSPTPVVCHMARVDRRKRPELFLELPARFPDVRFLFAGKSRDPRYEAGLRERYGNAPNLEWVGFLDQFAGTRHSELLGSSWVMVNCATREALPNSFLEAAAHGCAILSSVDLGGFVSRFGHHAGDDNFYAGLSRLLEDSFWRTKGEEGRAHIIETFELCHAIDLHEAAYREIMSR